MSSLQTVFYSSIATFRAELRPYLQRQEAENNLPLGLISRSDSEFPILAAVTDNNIPVLTAIQTDPPMNLVLSFSTRRDAAEVLINALRDRGLKPPGVVGPVGLVEEFVQRWATVFLQRARLEVAERIFAIDTVDRHRHSPGIARWAKSEDAGWLVPWVEDFTREALPEALADRARAMVERRLTIGLPTAGFLVWERGGHPVSLAGFGGPTGSGIRVGPVYTPPVLRNQGYGLAVVRELTARLFELDYQSIFLFTDLANPTSNSIYQKIGYRAVADVNQYHFFD